MLELTTDQTMATKNGVILDNARTFTQEKQTKKNLATKTQRVSGKKVRTSFKDTMRKTLTLGFREILKETWVVRISADGSTCVITKMEKKGR